MWLPSKVANSKVEKRKTGAAAVINMWPLAAIMLVILFILMTPSLVVVHPRSVPVDLPIAFSATAQPKAKRDDAITVSLTRDGSVFFRHEKVVLADLPQFIREAVKEGVEPRVYLAADARAKYGDVQAVAAKIREARIKDVVILTNPTH